MATTIIGGRNYRWRGKAFKTITQNEFTCVSLPRKDSMVMVPVNVNGENQYRITITASKNSGNGALLLNFFGGKNYDGPHIPINITNKGMQDYTVTVPTPKFPNNLPIYLRVWRPNDAKGNVTIRSIHSIKVGEYTQVKPKKIKSQKPKLYSNKAIEDYCKKIKALNKKIIVYFVSRVDQKRVFKYIKTNPNDGFCHVILVPSDKKLDSKFEYHEDYNKFLIKNIIIGNSNDDFQLAINCLNPAAFVCGTLPNFYQLKLPSECKKIFVSHGIIGNHVFDIEEIRKYGERWDGCSLYCGAGRYFEDFVSFMTNNKQNVASNTMPQLDILYHDQNDISQYGDLIKKQLGNFDKYILFAGFGGAERSDFEKHNRDYYRTAICLNELAVKNNWFVFIKPRLVPRLDIKFVENNDTVKEFEGEYKKLYNSKNVCMAHKLESIYKYFFCDAIVLNGTSTVEIEACCANKPLVIVRTEDDYDPMDTLRYNAALHVKTNDQESLENALKRALSGSARLSNKQNRLLKFHNISFDGQMGVRTYKEIIKTLK